MPGNLPADGTPIPRKPAATVMLESAMAKGTVVQKNDAQSMKSWGLSDEKVLEKVYGVKVPKKKSKTATVKATTKVSSDIDLGDEPFSDLKPAATVSSVKAPDAKMTDFQQPANLTLSEKAAISLYGKPMGYKVINPYLHTPGKVYDSDKKQYVDPTPAQVETAKKAISSLDSAFEKAPPTDQPLTIYRRSGFSFFGQDVENKIGQTFTSKSYTSTTTVADAKPGNGFGYESKKVLWEINLPAGTKALHGNDFESEILLPRDGQFTVTGVEKLPDGTTKVKTTYSPADKLSTPGTGASSSSSATNAATDSSVPSDTSQAQATSTAPTQSVAEKWAGKKVKKDSAEYWERAYDKTREAQAKQKPGSKLWQKLEERAQDQQAMVDYMKAAGKTSLTQEDWDANKAVYKTQTKNSLGTKTTDDADFIELDGGETKKVPAPKMGATSENTDTLIEDPAEAIKAAELIAQSKGQPQYVYKKWGDDTYSIGSNPPVDSSVPFKKVDPSGAFIGDSPSKPQKKVVNPGGTITAEDAAAKLGVDVAEIMDVMDDAQASMTTHKAWKSDWGSYLISTKNPDTKPTKDVPIVTIEPNGTIKYQDSSSGSGSSGGGNSTPVDNSWVIGNAPPAAAKEFDWAAQQAKQKNNTMYVHNGFGYWETFSMPPPSPNEPYFSVTPDGKIEKVEPGHAASPTSQVATTQNDAVAAGRAHAAAPEKPSAGPDTEFEFDDEETRKFGLDVINKNSNDYKGWGGTPEATAIAGRFVPTDSEVSRHYQASGAKLPSGSKTAIKSYQGAGYNSINDSLRGKTPASTTVLNKIEKIDQAMAEYATKEPMLLSRGLGFAAEFPKENLVGKMLQDAGYMSTSVGASGGFGGSTVLKIFAPAGIHGIPMNGAMGASSKYEFEKEFLLPRGTTILVSKDEVIDGVRTVTGTIVPLPKSSKTKSGVVDKPAGLSQEAYSKEGLEFLRTQGRAKWAKRYAKGQTLALARQEWYNRLVREKTVVIQGERT